MAKRKTKRADPIIIAEAKVAEHEATISRLHDLVAKFQRGGTSTLFTEGGCD